MILLGRSAILLLSTVIISTSGCGKKKDEASSPTQVLPRLDFSLPASSLALTDTNLAAVNGTNVLSEWAKRVDNVVTYLNTTLERLDNGNLQEKGSVTFTAASGATVKVTLADVVDTVYSKSATICVDGNPSLHMRWSSDQNSVEAVRDFAVDAWAGTKPAFKTAITYSKTDASTTLLLNAYGTPWAVPSDVSADTTNGGNYLGEYIEASKSSDGGFTFKGVNAWERVARTSATASTSFVGDAYLTGQLVADGSGSFVAWRKFNTICSNIAFDDGDSALPGWCFGADISSAGAATYTLDADSKWTDTTLKPFGIAPSSAVTFIEFDAGVTCN